MNPADLKQIRALIEDEAGLDDTLICYEELSTLIASADDLNPDTLWILLDTINRQFACTINNIKYLIAQENHPSR